MNDYTRKKINFYLDLKSNKFMFLILAFLVFSTFVIAMIFTNSNDRRIDSLIVILSSFIFFIISLSSYIFYKKIFYRKEYIYLGISYIGVALNFIYCTDSFLYYFAKTYNPSIYSTLLIILCISLFVDCFIKYYANYKFIFSNNIIYKILFYSSIFGVFGLSILFISVGIIFEENYITSISDFKGMLFTYALGSIFLIGINYFVKHRIIHKYSDGIISQEFIDSQKNKIK